MSLNLTEDRYKYTILHEFGHALGMKHEHQHKDAPPLYVEQKLREYVKKVMESRNEETSDKEAVAKKIRLQWAKLSTDSTFCSGNYDKDSVMHYL